MAKHDKVGRESDDRGIAGSTIAEQMRDLPVEAQSAMIENALRDQEVLLKARQLVNYGACTFTASDGQVSSKWGRKSAPAIECVVPIPLLGISIAATIWGELKTDTDGTRVVFAASMPRGIKSTDGDGKDRLLAHCENSAAEWSEFDKVTDRVTKLLTAPPRVANAKSGDKLTRPVLSRNVTAVPVPIEVPIVNNN